MICEWCKGVCFLCFCQMFQKLKGDRKNFSVSNFGWWIELPAWCVQTHVHNPVIYTNFVWLLLTWIGGCFSTQSSSHKWLFRRANAVWMPICGQQTGFLWFQGGKKETNINCSHSQKSVTCGFGCVSRTPWQNPVIHTELVSSLLMWNFPNSFCQNPNRKSLDQRVSIRIWQGVPLFMERSHTSWKE